MAIKSSDDQPVGQLPRSRQKRELMLNAAQELFLTHGYVGAGMEELTKLSGVSKQTLYAHFGSKENLFIEAVSSMTSDASDQVHNDVDPVTAAEEIPEFLRKYGMRQLDVVLQPRLLRLRRLVIGEVARFPHLAQVVYGNGPNRAIAALQLVFNHFDKAGFLAVDNPLEAAEFFNWAIMGKPLNQAMMLGDAGVLTARQRRTHVESATRIFLSAYGMKVS